MTWNPAPAFRRHLFAAVSLVFLLLASPLLAGRIYITTNDLDGAALLAPPPPPGSTEERADLAAIRSVVQARTVEEVAAAELGEELSLQIFAPAIGRAVAVGQYPKLETLLETLKTNVSGIITTTKLHWQRPRPYTLDPALLHGSPERSFSYPSGHSTRGTVQAFVLAEVFPEQRNAILKYGRQLGWDRTFLGKHYPTDINAGRVLGQAIFRELMKNRKFRRDLAAAKTEVRTARN